MSTTDQTRIRDLYAADREALVGDMDVRAARDLSGGYPVLR
jgi:hypothetical protein